MLALPSTLFLTMPLVQPLRLVTYNIRYDSMPDNITIAESIAKLPNPLTESEYLSVSGEQPWSLRRMRLSEQVLSREPYVIGLQEVLIRQVKDLAELFGTDWKWVGVGRDDGKEKGEFVPIFYDTRKVQLFDVDHFWLSDKPFEPSAYPGALPRVCTVAHLGLIENPNYHFVVLNAHLDHASDEERRVGASLLLRRAKYEVYTANTPVFVTGDFNSETTGDDAGAYKIMVGQIKPTAINSTFAERYFVPDSALPDFSMLDLRNQTARQAVSANFATFVGFNPPGDTKDWKRIDFVFGSSTGGWTAEKYFVDAILSDDGVLSSDHRPIFVDLELE